MWEYERGLGGRGERISGLDLEEEEEGGEWRTCWICVCSIGLVYYELELSNFNGEGGVCLLLFFLNSKKKSSIWCSKIIHFRYNIHLLI